MHDTRFKEFCGPWAHQHHREGPGHGYERGKGHPRLLGHPQLMLFPAILALLDERPSHGYELMGRLTELGLGNERMSPTTIYRILTRMESWGLVEHEHVEEGQGPVRKVFHLTEAGKADLNAWSKALADQTKFIKWFDEKYPAPAAPDEPESVTPPED